MSVLTTVGIVFSLIRPTIEFFREVRFGEFLTGTTGRRCSAAELRRAAAGAGTLVDHRDRACSSRSRSAWARRSTSASTPRPSVRKVLKPVLEVLAGIPTVVYGFFALTFVTPLLRRSGRSATAGIFNALAPAWSWAS